MILKTDSTHKIELHGFAWENVSFINIMRFKYGAVKVLYSGRADQVTEKMAKEFVKEIRLIDQPNAKSILYRNYKTGQAYLTALESFHSAHTKEFVIVTKTKK